jgi:BirA family biotin operon repressor/biotin-[acetyl-CoA-carboxylase] ligase
MLASGARLEVFDDIDSTSAEARRRMERGAAPSFYILGLRQTAGYGRRGSQWVQASGDVAVTYVTSADAPAERVAEWSFISGLAVRDAIAAFAAGVRLDLKWPNDILAANGKIAGLLCEYRPGRAGEADLAIGVGVNVVSKPDLAEYPAARLLDFAATVPTPAEFVQKLDAAIAARRAQWRQGGFAPIRIDWLSHAKGLGGPIRVRTPAGDVEGVFEDIDPAGALILSSGGERRSIAAGAILRT